MEQREKFCRVLLHSYTIFNSDVNLQRVAFDEILKVKLSGTLGQNSDNCIGSAT